MESHDNELQQEPRAGVFGKKGSWTNPYTLTEYFRLLAQNLWVGGFVQDNRGVYRIDGYLTTNSSYIGGYYGPVYYGGYTSRWYGTSNNGGKMLKNHGVARYEGSIRAENTGNDCVYKCLAYFLNIDSYVVSDLYGDKLKTDSTLTQTNNIIASGNVQTGNFDQVIVNRYHFLDSPIEYADIFSAFRNNRLKLPAMAYIYFAADPDVPGHCVVVEGIDSTPDPNKFIIRFFDPQRGTTGTMDIYQNGYPAIRKYYHFLQ